MEGKRSFIFDVAWIKRGVAKTLPDKVEIEKQELKEIIQGENETTDDETTDANEEHIEEDKQCLRGSASNLNAIASDGLEKYGLENYDEKTREKQNLMAGIAMFASPLEDPYITQHADSDEEEEKDDFMIKENDNLVVVAKIVKDAPSIEVYVFNEENDDWYLHHDYLLDSPPLCLASFTYDPGAHNKKFIEKSTKKKEKSRTKRDGSAQGHSDAVLCLDWNSRSEHVLASGSADKTVVLWDLDEAKVASIINNFGGMVQSIKWHPIEDSIILTGTRSGKVSMLDCRNVETETSAEWNLGESVEIEKVLWDRFNLFSAYVASDDGYLRYIDSRNPNNFIFEVLCHENGTTSVSQSVYTKSLIATCGENEFKIWKALGEEIKLVYAHNPNMGDLHTVNFSPDSGSIIIVGGEKEDMVRVFDLNKFDKVVENFCSEDSRME